MHAILYGISVSGKTTSARDANMLQIAAGHHRVGALLALFISGSLLDVNHNDALNT